MSTTLVKVFTLWTTLTFTTASNITDNQIKDLEKEKSDLYQQINKAIDDSLNTLKLSNDTDSWLTLNQMKELKKQIKELNGTEDNVNNVRIDEIDDEIAPVADHNDNSSDIRRHGTLVSDRNNNIQLDLSELAKLLKKKGDYTMQKQNPKITENQIQMFRKLELWVLQRQKEREKIAEYQNKIKTATFKFEKCPRFGFGNRGKKKFRRKGSHNKDKKKKSKSKSLYPCCRKCCKGSYMGCL